MEDRIKQRIRLNKYLSEAGVCSRREADRLIESGEVTVNGETAVTGMRIEPEDKISVRGKIVREKDEMVLLLFHKPRGIVCTAQKKEKNNIIDYVKYPIRVYPVGRLDKDSEGLILLTNNGDLVNKIMRAGNCHEKEYVVKVNKEITGEFLERMSSGVPILNTRTRPCRISKIGPYTFSIVLTQGLNRQIRRMCEYLGYEVMRLRRERIMNLKIDNIPQGKYRKITPDEFQLLNDMLKDSTSFSWKERSQKERL